MNAEYQEKLLMKVVMRFGGKLLIPAPVRAVWTGVRSLKYLQQGIASLKKGRLEVAALDATAIGVSILLQRYEYRKFDHVHARYRRITGGMDT